MDSNLGILQEVKTRFKKRCRGKRREGSWDGGSDGIMLDILKVEGCDINDEGRPTFCVILNRKSALLCTCGDGATRD